MQSDNLKKPMEKADILLEVLPYIRRFYNKIIVIKYGGHAMSDDNLKGNVCHECCHDEVYWDQPCDCAWRRSSDWSLPQETG